MQQLLYLRRLRDFGEKISDSFLFLKQNWKMLFGVYAVFVVPFLLAGIIMGMFFAGHIYSTLLSNAESLRPGDILTGEFFVIILCFLFAGSSYNTAVYCYFRLYDEQQNQQPTLQQVGQLFFKKIMKVLLGNIIVTVILAVIVIIPVFLLVKIPILGPIVIFFGAILAFLFFIVIMFYLNCIFVADDEGLSGSVSRLFYLLANRWWNTIGFTLVIFLIYYVFSFIIQMVATIIMSIFSLSFITPFASQAGGSAGKGISVMVLLFGLMMLLQQVFYLIVFCGIGVNYYSLTEEKDGSAIEAQIDSIGDASDRYGGVEEQY